MTPASSGLAAVPPSPHVVLAQMQATSPLRPTTAMQQAAARHARRPSRRLSISFYAEPLDASPSPKTGPRISPTSGILRLAPPHIDPKNFWIVLLFVMLLVPLVGVRFGLALEPMLSDSVLQQRFTLVAAWSLFFFTVNAAFLQLWANIPDTGLTDDLNIKLTASRCLGTLHASIVVPLALLAMYRSSPKSFLCLGQKYLAANTALEYRIMEISAGFFLADLLMFLVAHKFSRSAVGGKQNVLIFAHHTTCIVLMLVCGWAQHAAPINMGGLVWAEITSPIVSGWTLAKAARHEGHLIWLSPLFTGTFVVARCGIMTVSSLVWLIPQCLMGREDGAINLAWRLLWIFLDVLIVYGGWIWSIEICYGLAAFYRKRAKAHAALKAAQEAAAAASPTAMTELSLEALSGRTAQTKAKPSVQVQVPTLPMLDTSQAQSSPLVVSPTSRLQMRASRAFALQQLRTDDPTTVPAQPSPSKSIVPVVRSARGLAPSIPVELGGMSPVRVLTPRSTRGLAPLLSVEFGGPTPAPRSARGVAPPLPVELGGIVPLGEETPVEADPQVSQIMPLSNGNKDASEEKNTLWQRRTAAYAN